MRRWSLHAAGLLILCLLCMNLAFPAMAVARQVAVVVGKDLYVDGEQLQMQARLLPPEDGVSWAWECKLPGKDVEIVSKTDKVILDLTLAYHGAVLCPVATLPDGTVLRGPEKTLVVERYCLGLELAAMPEKNTYALGEVFDPAGSKITAKMSDGSLLDVTDACVWDTTSLEQGTSQVLATCLLRRDTGEMGTFGCYIPITVKAVAQPEDEKKDPVVPDKDIVQKPDGTEDQDGSKNDDWEQKPGTTEKTEDVLTEKPTWSKDNHTGVMVVIGLLALCLVIGLVIWWILCRKQQGRTP